MMYFYTNMCITNPDLRNMRLDLTKGFSNRFEIAREHCSDNTFVETLMGWAARCSRQIL